MKTDDLNTKSRGSNSPRNPRQNAPEIPDGSLTKGGVTGQNPATKTKQQTAQMPMKSKIAAQTARNATDGRGGGIRTHDLLVPNEARYQAAPRPDSHSVSRSNAVNRIRFSRDFCGDQVDFREL